MLEQELKIDVLALELSSLQCLITFLERQTTPRQLGFAHFLKRARSQIKFQANSGSPWSNSSLP
jgi:hypothetical protein